MNDSYEIDGQLFANVDWHMPFKNPVLIVVQSLPVERTGTGSGYNIILPMRPRWSLTIENFDDDIFFVRAHGQTKFKTDHYVLSDLILMVEKFGIDGLVSKIEKLKIPA